MTLDEGRTIQEASISVGVQYQRSLFCARASSPIAILLNFLLCCMNTD